MCLEDFEDSLIHDEVADIFEPLCGTGDERRHLMTAIAQNAPLEVPQTWDDEENEDWQV